MEQKRGALRIALVAVLSAVVVVFTMIVRIPTAKGYLNLCDVAVCFIAFTFGPWTALLAGGIGAAMADLFSGYAQWAPISFVCHGLEGLLVALAVRKKPVGWLQRILAAGGALLSVVGGYFVLSGLLVSGFSVALAEVPENLGQVVVGLILGAAVAAAVKKAYPPVEELAW